VLTRAGALGAGTEAAVERVRVLVMSGRAGEALAVGDGALRAAGGDARVELALALARAAVTMARWEQALAYLERANHPGDPRVHVLAAAATAFRRAADLAEAHGLVPWRIRALQGLGFCELLATETSSRRPGGSPRTPACSPRSPRSTSPAGS
jgi:hypothetical protein